MQLLIDPPIAQLLIQHTEAPDQGHNFRKEIFLLLFFFFVSFYNFYVCETLIKLIAYFSSLVDTQTSNHSHSRPVSETFFFLKAK